MNPKDKYNAIIETIEKEINTALSNAEICEDAFKAGHAEGLEPRGRNALFAFMIKQSVDEYINERRMMHVYNYLITTPKYDLNKAYDMAHVSSQGKFIAKFKRFFNDLTPDKAAKAKDESLIRPAKTWELVTAEAKETFTKISEGEGMTETKFGVSPMQAINIHAAQTLQNFFGLNDKEADFAFRLAEDHSLTYDESFEYVYNYVWKFIEDDKINQDLRDKRLYEDLDNADVQFLYFRKKKSFSAIYDFLEAKENQGIEGNIKSLSPSEFFWLEKWATGERSKKLRLYPFEEACIYYDEDEPEMAYDEEYNDPYDESDLYDSYGDPYWELCSYFSEEAKEIDLNNTKEYEKLCEKIERAQFFKGNLKRRLPKFRNSLSISEGQKQDAELKKEIERHIAEERDPLEQLGGFNELIKENSRQNIEKIFDPVNYMPYVHSWLNSSFNPDNACPKSIFLEIKRYIANYPEDADCDWIKGIIKKAEHYYDYVKIWNRKCPEKYKQNKDLNPFAKILEEKNKQTILTWKDYQKEERRKDEERKKRIEEEKKREEEREKLEEEIRDRVFECEEGDRILYNDKEYTIASIVDRGIARIRDDNGNEVKINLFYCFRNGLAKKI